MRIARLGMLLGMLSGLPAPGLASQPEFDGLIEQGMNRLFQGDRDGADRIWQRLREIDPTHPAAPVYEVATLYWRQVYDELDERFDAAIEARSQEAIRLAQARLAVDADDADAHFYLGQAYVDLGRLEGVRGRYLAAGRHGERGRAHLERALELEPDRVDARYPVGLYYYYADLVTRWFRWLRWLPFVPSGDGETGLRYLEQVAEHGRIHRFNARFILANIRTYHEPDQVGWALRTIEELHTRFPRNTLIHFEWIELLLMTSRYEEVVQESLELEAFEGGDELDQNRRELARIWRARAQLHAGRPGEAWRTLERYGDGEPESPTWGPAWVRLVRAQILDVRGARKAAVREYRTVKRHGRSERASQLADEGLERPFRLGPVLRARP